MMADLLHSFKALYIPIDESTLDEFVHSFDKNSEEFSHEILDDVNEVLKSIQATNDNKDENVYTVVESCAHSPAPTGSMSLFVGLSTYTIKFLKLRTVVVSRCASSSRKLAYYNELRNSFELFQQ